MTAKMTMVPPEIGNTRRVDLGGEGSEMSSSLYLLSIELTHSISQQQALNNFLITTSLFLMHPSFDGLNCVPSKIHILQSWPLVSHNVTIFGDRVFKEIIEVKWGFLVAQWYRICLPMHKMQETWLQALGQEDPLRRKWQHTLAFLPGKSHRQRSPVGYSPWGCKKSVMT